MYSFLWAHVGGGGAGHSGGGGAGHAGGGGGHSGGVVVQCQGHH